MGQQLSLNGFDHRSRLCFGASLLKNSHAKVSRPLSPKKPLHLVMRSKYAMGNRSLLKHEKWIRNVSVKLGRKNGVKIFHLSTDGKALSMVLRFSKRKEFHSFLRALSGLIARKVLAAEKGCARRHDTAYKHQEDHQPHSQPMKGLIVKKGERFWDQRPFTRILNWGPDFSALKNALLKKCGSRDALESLSIGFLTKRIVNTLGSHQIYAKVQIQIHNLLNST